MQNYSKSGRYANEKPHREVGEAGGGRLSCSVVAVEVDACEVFGAVGEAVECDLQRGGARGGEDVRQQAGREVGEVNVDEEAFKPFGAYCRIVGEVGEAVLCDAFVRCNHNAMF